MKTGIAHVSFPGGGIFLPARSPYDRQILIELVTDRVHCTGEVQVLLDGERWRVQLRRGGCPRCAYCGTAVHPTCNSMTHGERGYCVNCAFGDGAALVPVAHEPGRQTT